MPIYTKTGDEGFSLVPGQPQRRKSDVRFDAIGDIDELNSLVGFCLSEARRTLPMLEEGEGLAGRAGAAMLLECLSPLQAELLALGAMFCMPGQSVVAPSLLDESAITRMEAQIDRVWHNLPELRHFILPGGCELACRLHLARTACRRAERALVSAADAGPVEPVLLQYINRLSDFLFALARLANHAASHPELPWQP